MKSIKIRVTVIFIHAQCCSYRIARQQDWELESEEACVDQREETDTKCIVLNLQIN